MKAGREEASVAGAARKMKDSGIAWLGEVPEEWGRGKIKHLFTERSQRGYPDEPLLVASQNMGVVPKSVYGKRTVVPMKDLHLLKLVKVGDFVISLRSFEGGIELAHYQGIISPAYKIIVPDEEKITRGYFKYLAKSKPFIDLLRVCVTGIREGQNIDYKKLKNNYIPLPPLSEQETIARYLDGKVSKIDRLLDARRKEVAALKELKQALINERISEKAHADAFKKLKHVALCNRSTLSEKTPPDYKFRYVDIASVDSAKGITQYQEMTFGDSPSRARRIVRNGDIIISTVRTYLRAISKIEDDKDVIVSTGFAVITPKDTKDANSKYLEYCFKSDLFCDEVIRRSAGVAYPAINAKALMNIAIPLPPREEQDAIARYLDDKTAKIDKIAAVYTKEIALLEELKAAVIADGVRGNLVCSW